MSDRWVPGCMSGSLIRGGGEALPVFPAHEQPAIFRIWQEANDSTSQWSPVIKQILKLVWCGQGGNRWNLVIHTLLCVMKPFAYKPCFCHRIVYRSNAYIEMIQPLFRWSSLMMNISTHRKSILIYVLLFFLLFVYCIPKLFYSANTF